MSLTFYILYMLLYTPQENDTLRVYPNVPACVIEAAGAKCLELVLPCNELQELCRETTIDSRKMFVPQNTIVSTIITDFYKRHSLARRLPEVPIHWESRDTVEDIRLRIRDRAHVLNYWGHERVVNHHDPSRCLCQRLDEWPDRAAEVGRGLEDRHEVVGELGIWVRVRWWRLERRDVEVVEMEVVVLDGWMRRVVGTDLGLVDVRGGADVVDGYVVGGGQASWDVEELVEMTLRRQGNHYHCNLGCSRGWQ